MGVRTGWSQHDLEITDDPPYGIMVAFLDYEDLDEFDDFLAEAAGYDGEIAFDLDFNKMWFSYPSSIAAVAELLKRFKNQRSCEHT